MRMRETGPSPVRNARACLAMLIAAVLAASAYADPGAAGDGLVVNINTASFEELQHLPGVGETRAEAILAERKARGGFTSVDELIEVKGIGPTSLERLRPHVRVAGKTQVPLSDASRP